MGSTSFKVNNLKHYWRVHQWLHRKYGSAHKCVGENCESLTNKFHWANISGKYLFDITDWQQMCTVCHGVYDRNTHCVHGHLRKLTNSGKLRCFECHRASSAKYRKKKMSYAG